MSLILIFAAGLTFACAAYGGTLLAAACFSRMPLALTDGPRPVPPPVSFIVISAGLLGAIIASRGTPPLGYVVFALLTFVLAAIWYCDMRWGVIPDALTIIPLIAVVVLAIVEQSWWTIASAIVPAIPFAIAAAISKGYGMGWGDVKFVALGGAVIGMQSAVLFFAASCFAAVIVSAIQRRGSQPVAFAPYLICGVAASLALGWFG